MAHGKRGFLHHRRLGFEDGLARAAGICRTAIAAYDGGAGSDHSEEARKVGKAQAEWCLRMIRALKASS